MLTMPLGLLAGADASVLEMLFKNFLPTTLGKSLQTSDVCAGVEKKIAGKLPHHHHQGHWLQLDGLHSRLPMRAGPGHGWQDGGHLVPDLCLRRHRLRAHPREHVHDAPGASAKAHELLQEDPSERRCLPQSAEDSAKGVPEGRLPDAFALGMAVWWWHVQLEAGDSNLFDALRSGGGSGNQPLKLMEDDLRKAHELLQEDPSERRRLPQVQKTPQRRTRRRLSLTHLRSGGLPGGGMSS